MEDVKVPSSTLIMVCYFLLYVNLFFASHWFFANLILHKKYFKRNIHDIILNREKAYESVYLNEPDTIMCKGLNIIQIKI